MMEGGAGPPVILHTTYMFHAGRKKQRCGEWCAPGKSTSSFLRQGLLVRCDGLLDQLPQRSGPLGLQPTLWAAKDRR